MTKLMAKGAPALPLLTPPLKLNQPADTRPPSPCHSPSSPTDLRLAHAAAQQAGVPLPVGTLTNTLYNKLAEHDEFATKDFSVVYEYLRVAAESGQLKK